MSRKDNNLKVRLNLQIDEETLKMTKNLREKHHINLSSLCRESIIKKYKELNENNKVN
jgi:hypothetical protein